MSPTTGFSLLEARVTTWGDTLINFVTQERGCTTRSSTTFPGHEIDLPRQVKASQRANVCMHGWKPVCVHPMGRTSPSRKAFGKFATLSCCVPPRTTLLPEPVSIFLVRLMKKKLWISSCGSRRAEAAHEIAAGVSRPVVTELHVVTAEERSRKLPSKRTPSVFRCRAVTPT